jgi:uncharacterized protein YfaS (alpha-2-macroglobulin family)
MPFALGHRLHLAIFAACALAVFASVCRPAAAARPNFVLGHVVIPTDAASPTACLRFTQDLARDPGTHVGDYIALAPAAKPAITVTGSELCLGGLDYTTTYKLTLRAGLPAASGDRLAAPQTVELRLAPRPPLVAIAGDGYILSRHTAHGLTIQTMNVTQVKIHVLRMSDKLLPTQLNGGLQLAMQTTDPWTIMYWLRRQASVVWSGTMDVPEDHNRTVETAFPIASIVPPGRNGLYLVVAENAAHAQPEALFNSHDGQPTLDDFNTVMAAHWVVATDIALTSMRGSDGLHVFARSPA